MSFGRSGKFFLLSLSSFISRILLVCRLGQQAFGILMQGKVKFFQLIVIGSSWSRLVDYRLRVQTVALAMASK